MTGEKKHGLYRTLEGNEIRFFRVRNNDDGKLVIRELTHETGVARQIKDSEKLLTDEIWEKLVTWQ